MEFVEDGRRRVVEDAGRFAYFQESKAIEYDMERYCQVTQRGSLLDNKGIHYLPFFVINKHSNIQLTN